VTKLVRLLKLNGLEYNVNRDPQVYRRVTGKPFRFEALLDGTGTADVRFIVAGKTVHESIARLPDRLDFTVSFETPGIRVGELLIESTDARYERYIRLDVEEKEWTG